MALEQFARDAVFNFVQKSGCWPNLNTVMDHEGFLFWNLQYLSIAYGLLFYDGTRSRLVGPTTSAI